MMRRNPYFITGPAQFGFSGGRTSAFMLYRTLKAHGGHLPKDCYVTFHNTGKEREETLVFVKECGDRWGVPVVWTEFNGVYGEGDGLAWKIVDFETASRNGEPFRKVIEYYKQLREVEKDSPPVLPNPAQRMCTDRMKIKAAKWFMNQQGYDEWDAFIGIRADEPSRYHKRIAANQRGKDPWYNVMPLAEDGIKRGDVNRFWQAQPFDLQLDPNSDEGNCDLCMLKTQMKKVWILMKDPSRADWWIEQEEYTGQKFRNDHLTYRQMKEQAIYWLEKRPNYGATGHLMRENIELFGPDPEEKIADCLCGDD